MTHMWAHDLHALPCLGLQQADTRPLSTNKFCRSENVTEGIKDEVSVSHFIPGIRDCSQGPNTNRKKL